MKNLKLALEAVYLNELDSMPSEVALERQINISLEFDQRMKELFRNQTTAMPGRRVKRMLLIAIIAALMTSAMSVQAIREPIEKFFLEIYDICTDIIFQQSENSSVEEYEFFVPEFPEGYIETRREVLETQIKVEYKTENNGYLRYTQYLLDGMALSIDTEDADVKLDQIQGNNVFLYSNKGFNSIIWSDGTFGYKLNTTCDVEELRNIAKRIMEEIK